MFVSSSEIFMTLLSILCVVDQQQLVKLKLNTHCLYCIFHRDLQTFGISLDETQQAECKPLFCTVYFIGCGFELCFPSGVSPFLTPCNPERYCGTQGCGTSWVDIPVGVTPFPPRQTNTSSLARPQKDTHMTTIT